MGMKLIMTGLTLIMAKTIIPLPVVEIVGEVFMIVGTIIMWMDR